MKRFTEFESKELDILSDIDYCKNTLSITSDPDKRLDLIAAIDHFKHKLSDLRNKERGI